MHLELDELQPLARELVRAALGITHAQATAVLAAHPDIYHLATEAVIETRALLEPSEPQATDT